MPIPWTPSAVLKDNLLLTFILNVLLSELRGRRWSVTVATASPIRRAHIEEFVTAPHQSANLCATFEQTVDEAHRKWSEHIRSSDPAAEPPSRERVRSVALEILAQLAVSVPVGHDLLAKDIELELTKRFYDPIRVNETALYCIKHSPGQSQGIQPAH